MIHIDSKSVKKLLPRPREVWWVSHKSLLGINPSKEAKFSRPALVVAHDQLIHSETLFIPIIPLTTKGKPDKFFFPLPKNSYQHLEDKELDSKSKAMIQLYQSLKLDCFMKRFGKIEASAYCAIQHLLCTEYIGWDPKYDISTDETWWNKLKVPADRLARVHTHPTFNLPFSSFLDNPWQCLHLSVFCWK